MSSGKRFMTWRVGWVAMSVIVCATFSFVAQGGTGPRNAGPAAFIWDADNGMRDLTDLLIDDFGIDLGGSILTSANGISADGTVIWGQKSPLGDDGVRYWKLTLDGSTADYQPLTDLPSSFSSDTFPDFTLNAMSRDGKVFGGRVDDSREARDEAFIWSQATGVMRLGRLADNAISEVSALSFDGSVAVGRAGTPQFHAFRWTSETGMEDLGDLPGGANFSSALAVSDDGSVVVGDSSSANSGPSTTLTEAFRWTQETGMEGLGDEITGDAFFFSESHALSGDGDTVVGRISLHENNSWVPIEGLRSARLNGIAINGNFVVGVSISGDVQGAFLWNELAGFTELGDLPGGSTFSEAFAVSDDGTIVVGTVSVPEPGSLLFLIIVAPQILSRRGSVRSHHSSPTPRGLENA